MRRDPVHVVLTAVMTALAVGVWYVVLGRLVEHAVTARWLG